MRFRLKELLEDRKVTQYQLAKAIGVSHPSVNAWVKGRLRKGEWVQVYPDPDSLEKICAFLECSISDVFQFDPNVLPYTYRSFQQLVVA